MCGLVGIAGNLEFKDEATMKRLLLIDYLRGPDSTGLAAIRKTNDVKLAKAAVNPIDFFDMGKFKEALVGTSSKAFIGHNRAATKGVVNNVNAHPYQVDHIVGAHNGTLDTLSHRELEEAVGEKFGTDSHAIFAAIAKFGIEDTVKMLKGAWSLVWFDLQKDTLNFLRNKERPLWYSYTKDLKKLIWASEWPMLDVATRMAGAGKEYEFYQDKDKYRFFQTAEDTWYRYDLTALAAGGDVAPKPKVKTLKGKETVVTTTTYDPFNRRGGVGSTTTGQTNSTTPSTTSPGKKRTFGKPPKLANVVHLFGGDDNPTAGVLTREQFDEIAKYGCSWCGASIDATQQGVTIFERDQVCLCPTCSGGDNQATRIHITNLDQLL